MLCLVKTQNRKQIQISTQTTALALVTDLGTI